MQDTAEGFGQPIRQIFEPFFRIERELPTPVRRAAVLSRRDRGPPLVLALRAGIARGRAAVARSSACCSRAAFTSTCIYSFVTLIAAAGVRRDEPGAVFASQLLQTLLAVLLAPLMLGWVNQCRAWLQNKSGAGRCCSRTACCTSCSTRMRCSRTTPRRCSAPRPTSSSAAWCSPRASSRCSRPICRSPPAADAIALVGLFALARVFMALAAMDIGTAFGTLGARREMLVGFLAEPALLMVLFTACADQPVDRAHHHRRHARRSANSRSIRAWRSPAVAFMMVLLAENARIPIDNPATHLELTMIHEAMILEYSARHLALIEWAAASSSSPTPRIGIALFVPWGIVAGRRLGRCCRSRSPLLVVEARGRRAPGSRCSKRCRPRCASSARRSSSARPSCSRARHADPLPARALR